MSPTLTNLSRKRVPPTCKLQVLTKEEVLIDNFLFFLIIQQSKQKNKSIYFYWEQIQYKILESDILRMNKFYENYKDLFTEQQEAKPLYYLNQRSQKHDYSQNLYSKYQYGRERFNSNLMGNEFRRLFNQYETNDLNNNYRLKTQESPAGKQLKEVILPKLNVYEKQIQRKLKRFKAQQKTNLNFSNLYQNHSCLYPEYITQKQLTKTSQNQLTKNSNKRIKTQSFRKYKYGPKRSLQKYKLNESQEIYRLQTQLTDQLNAAGKPSIKFHKQNQILNPENQNIFYPNQQHKLKSAVISKQNKVLPLSEQKSFQSQYQRCFSNKKIRHKKKINDPIIKTFNTLKKNFPTFNFHKVQNPQIQDYGMLNLKDQSLLQKPFDKKQVLSFEGYQFKQKKTLGKLKSQNAPEVEKQIENTFQNIKIPSKKKKIRQNPIERSLKSEQGLKFSEYENQYAFINKRLQDIQHFNNFYSHKCINSYKKAIMRRLRAKENQDQRRNKLKILLAKQQISLQDQ